MKNVLQAVWTNVTNREPEAVAMINAATGQRNSRADIEEYARSLHSEYGALLLARRGVLLRRANGPDWLATLLALRRLNAVIIPLDPATSDTEVERLAVHLRVAAVLTENGICAVDAKPRQWKPGVALIKVTSGSSGTPSAIPFSEAELMQDGLNVLSTMGITTQDLNYALLPFGHSYALGNLVTPLIYGVPLVLGSAPLPRVISEEITATGATVFPSTPAVFEAVTRTDDISLGQLRLCISAAAPLKPELAQRFDEKFGQRLHNFYGASECGGIAYDRDGSLGLTGESVGGPMFGVTLSRAVDGRLRVCSGAVSRYGRPGKGYATVTLGDRVSFTEAGNVMILGRADRVVKCTGRRIDLNALEKAAIELGATRAAAWFDEARGHLYVAVVGVSAEQALTNLQGLFSAVRGRIRVRAVDEIPTTARGKVDIRKLAQQ